MELTDRSKDRDSVVIVIDDDDAVRNSLKFSLEVEGFKVEIFADGQEFLGQAKLPACGCLVIDQNLPKVRGLEIIAELRRRRFVAPAILITSHPSESVRRQAHSAGIPIIEKPLLSGILVDMVQQAMGRSAPPRY